MIGAIRGVQVALDGAELRPLRTAVDEFESIMVQQVFTAMRRMVEKTKVGDSLGGDTFQDMFDASMAKSATGTMRIGLADRLFQDMAPIALVQAREAAKGGKSS